MNLFASNKMVEFKRFDLGNGYFFWVGQLPNALMFGATQFESLWRLHPDEFHEIKMHGRLVKTPRWQQAYGEDYYYSGHVNKALPIPPAIAPLLEWAKKQLDERLNGILLNWYDGKLGHYIGRHRDSTVNLYPGGPIVTISLGEERIFRLRPWRSQHTAQEVDFTALDGTVFVMPFQTNAAWTHEVPAFRKWQGRRISVTFRAFALHRQNRSHLPNSIAKAKGNLS